MFTNTCKNNRFQTIVGSQYGLQDDPRSVQDGPKTILKRFFSHRFLISVLVGLGFDFGSFCVPCSEPKSVIFGIDFLMVFACRSKIAPRAVKSPPGASQERPRAAQEEPQSGQESTRASNRDPRPIKSEQTQQESTGNSKSKSQK